MTRSMRLLLLLTICCVCVSGCRNGSTVKKAESQWTPDNEIISYERIDSNKTVITLGEYAGIETSLIAQAIEEKFADVDIVVLKNAAGREPQNYLFMQKEQNDLPDIIFGNTKIVAPGFL